MGDRLRILILEDVPDDAVLMEFELQNAGIASDTVRIDNREAYIAELKRHPPDLVLSDYSLPRFDGMDALRLLKAACPDVPFIVVTGTVSEETAVDFIKAGADDYVLKNHLSRLASAVQGAQQKRRAFTEKKKAEDALLASETRYRRLFVSAREGILLFDANTLKVTDANPYLSSLLGRPLEDILELEVGQIGLFPGAGEIRALLDQLERSDDADFEGSLVRARDGSTIDIEMACNRYVIENRKLIQCNVRDVTERKRSEEDKETMRAQLFQAQKMEAIGNLAGGVAHDFNNLMTAIQVSADVAMMKVDDSHLLFRDLKEIRHAALRASGLIRQLLLFSRKHPMEFTFIDLNGSIENLIKMLHRLIGEDIEIVPRLAPDLWTVRADANNMEQVVMNLALNARDAMPRGGKLVIQTENQILNADARKDMPESGPGKFIRLSISDNGTGMDPETMIRCFEPFFTTKGPGRGTGLGLSVVYGIVKQHDGWIHITSVQGRGSTFAVYLPATTETAEEVSEEKVQFESLKGRGQSILLVEDEEKVRVTAQKALEKCGYRVCPVKSVAEALGLFRKENGGFDLVFSDVVLSDRTGIELAEEMMAIRPGIRLLLSSGYTDQKSQWPVIREKGYRFLQKPYSLSDLLKAVRAALESP